MALIVIHKFSRETGFITPSQMFDCHSLIATKNLINGSGRRAWER